MTNCNLKTACLVVLLASVPATPARDGEGPEAAFAAAARKRQQLVRSFEATITRTEVTEPGGLSEKLKDAEGAGKTVPATQTTTTSVSRLVFGGTKARFENGHPVWNAAENAWKANKTFSAFDGRLAKAHWPEGMASSNNPVGVIRPSTEQLETRLQALLPLTLALRGHEVQITPHLVSRFKYKGPVTFKGKPAEAYSLKPSSRSTLDCVVDPASGWNVVQLRRVTEGKLVLQIDVSFSVDPAIGPYPSGWTTTRFTSAGRLAQTTHAAVTDARFNHDPPDETFDVVFTPGTHLTDYRTGRDFIVEPDGSHRDVTPKNPGATDAPPWHGWHSPWVWGLLVAGALLVLAALTRRLLWKKEAEA